MYRMKLTTIAEQTENVQRMDQQTLFHIDFEWWARREDEYLTYLYSLLCDKHQKEFGYVGDREHKLVDWVNPQNGEVFSIDSIEYSVRSHCSIQKDYIIEGTPMVDSVFRVLLANGNQPLTIKELASCIGRVGQESTILRMLGGRKMYKGLRPL